MIQPSDAVPPEGSGSAGGRAPGPPSGGATVTLPTAYAAGLERARKCDPDLAATYVAHTVVGDPIADAVAEALAPFDIERVHRFIRAGMERGAHTLAEAPRALREFFDRIETPPLWFDPQAMLPGRRAFHAYSDLFIPAFFVATLRNFTNLMGEVFHLTERVTSDQGLRRIRQNVRHFIEIMLPGAMLRHGDGWKQSVRIRLVHAQARRLIRTSGAWDEAARGMPLNAAHMGLASANFSATQLVLATRLGARMDDDARAGFMQVWRYASLLAGTPEALLFEGDETATRAFSRIAHLCEPPPGRASAVVAHAAVAALPKIAGKTDPGAAQAMRHHAYRVSRALLGDAAADRLGFPRQRTAGLLAWMRWQRRALGLAHRLLPNAAGSWRGAHMAFLLEASMLDDLSYRVPDHLKADRATPW